ncbi:hypothetical protein PG997_006728 [Apiospora hydei]|uniref:Uncharacterized protein n=1 Tax=Apiospora hydei TaxID=1337664 RepID=A0ABR1WPI4_9PEZI
MNEDLRSLEFTRPWAKGSAGRAWDDAFDNAPPDHVFLPPLFGYMGPTELIWGRASWTLNLVTSRSGPQLDHTDPAGQQHFLELERHLIAEQPHLPVHLRRDDLTSLILPNKCTHDFPIGFHGKQKLLFDLVARIVPVSPQLLLVPRIEEVPARGAGDVVELEQRPSTTTKAEPEREP